MTLQQLEYFRVLAKLEHFTKASEVLSISQPSLSYAIGQLESKLGVPLFERKGRNIELNSYGKIFLTYVETSLNTLEQGVENLDLLTKTISHSVKVGYIYSLTNILLNDIIKKFYLISSNEMISFDFKTDSNDLLIKDLEKGVLDIAFCVTPPQHNEYIRIFDQKLYLFVHRDHIFAQRSEVSISELEGFDFINYRSNTGLRMITDNMFKANSIYPNIKFEIDECNAALSLIYLNIGITIMPIVPGIDYSKVALINIREMNAIRRVYLSWNDSIHTNPQVKNFRDFVIELYDNNNLL